MNILILSHEYPPIGGGGASACRNLSHEYAKLGHKVTIVTAHYRDCPLEEVVDGVKIIRVKAKRANADTSSFFEMLTYLIGAYRYTDKLCKKEHYDVCQVFFGIPSGPIGLHIRRKYKIPYVIRFGGGDIPGAQKPFAVIYKVLSPIIRSIWKNASALVANSETLKNRAQELEIRYDIRVITNGIDIDYYHRRTEYRCDGDINMLFVSRLIEGKGLQYVIPRMNEINHKCGKRVSLTIIGDGPYREYLESLINEDNSNLVFFKGRLIGDELLSYYDKSNLFAFPSLSEGMPNVVLEAMSMGLPIAMTDCGGSRELIKDNGFAVNIEIFVEELKKLCVDKDRMYKYSIESRKRAESMFGWKSKAEEYLNVFSDILSD